MGSRISRIRDGSGLPAALPFSGVGAGRRGRKPDPWAASDQAEFRVQLRALMRGAGFGSLQQLEAAAPRRGVAMPVSTADRALSPDPPINSGV
jgi:hypothetical protein